MEKNNNQVETPATSQPVQPVVNPPKPKSKTVPLVQLLVGVFLIVWGIGYSFGLFFVDQETYDSSGFGGIWYFITLLFGVGVGFPLGIIGLLRLIGVSRDVFRQIVKLLIVFFVDLFIIFSSGGSFILLIALAANIVGFVLLYRANKKAGRVAANRVVVVFSVLISLLFIGFFFMYLLY